MVYFVPGNHKIKPLSITSLVEGLIMFFNKAYLGFGACFNPVKSCKTVKAFGPDIRTTATPALP